MPSILIINSDESILEYLANLFRNTNYKIVVTTNSSLATSLFNQHKPCTVIIDIYMGEKDGFDVTKEIRKICQTVFIMVISANDKYLNSITYLGADLALPISIHSEFIINAVAVAVKAQAYSNKSCSSSNKWMRKKNLLKIA